MNLGNNLRRWLRRFRRGSMDRNAAEETLVFAVTHCYPTRLALYAAAFQGGWRISFRRSIREAAEAARSCGAKAVFYDPAGGDSTWKRYCSLLSREGVPFVFLGHRSDDDAFLAVLASGGYSVAVHPLTSEEIVKAVDFAGEVAALARVPVS